MSDPIVSVDPILLPQKPAAKALGICERTLRDYSKAGKIPVVRIGKRVLYDPRDLRAWVDQQKTTAA